MDKFGIFNLLSTALGAFNKNKEDTEQKKDDLSKKEEEKQISLPKNKPLQDEMLSVMRGHDTFVKRVLDRNSNK